MTAARRRGHGRGHVARDGERTTGGSPGDVAADGCMRVGTLQVVVPRRDRRRSTARARPRRSGARPRTATTDRRSRLASLRLASAAALASSASVDARGRATEGAASATRRAFPLVSAARGSVRTMATTQQDLSTAPTPPVTGSAQTAPVVAARVLPVGRRQEVGDGDHRHRAAWASCSPTWSATSRCTWAPTRSTTTASSCASCSCRSLPRTVVLWLLRIGAHRRLRAPHPRRVRAHPDEPPGPAGEYESQRDYVAANFARRTMRWTGHHRRAVPRLPPRRPDVGRSPTPTSCVATCTTTWSHSFQRVPVAIALHRRQPRARHPPVPRRVEPVPEPRLEQPALQQVAPVLRHRRSRPSS